MDQSKLKAYLEGGRVLQTAIDGLTPEQLNAFPVPGTWSIQQIVIHVLDSDLASTHRMRRVIAEEKPLIIGYDESAFAKSLFYESTDAVKACKIFELNRELMADTLSKLPASAFKRIGIHNERGAVSLEDFVDIYIHHIDHHMKFVREKRALLGKPLA